MDFLFLLERVTFVGSKLPFCVGPVGTGLVVMAFSFPVGLIGKCWPEAGLGGEIKPSYGVFGPMAYCFTLNEEKSMPETNNFFFEKLVRKGSKKKKKTAKVKVGS